MVKSPIIIGIHGKPHSGKDTICNEIIRHFPDLERFGPSVFVKKVAALQFQVPIHYFYDETLKEMQIPRWQLCPREMAQRIGKECSRDKFGEDFWLEHVELYLYNLKLLNNTPHYSEVLERGPNDFNKAGIILADIRYENEVQWVKRNGGKVVFVTRENRSTVTNEGHEAEWGLPEHLADKIIRNDGTLDDLYYEIGKFLLWYSEN